MFTEVPSAWSSGFQDKVALPPNTYAERRDNWTSLVGILILGRMIVLRVWKFAGLLGVDLENLKTILEKFWLTSVGGQFVRVCV